MFAITDIKIIVEKKYNINLFFEGTYKTKYK